HCGPIPLPPVVGWRTSRDQGRSIDSTSNPRRGRRGNEAMVDHATPSARHNLPLIAFLSVMAASLAALMLFVPVIPQSQAYHQFADQRTLLGIPNFWNVVSNLPFIAVGAVGLWGYRDKPAIIVIFAGIFLTGFGSAYYHWNPNDGTLFWDRLPMALAFSAIMA